MKHIKTLNELINNKKLDQYCYIGLGSGVLKHIKKNGIFIGDKKEDIKLYRTYSDAKTQSLSMAHNGESPIILRTKVSGDIRPVLHDENDPNPNNYKEFTTNIKIIPNRIELKKGNTWESLI